MSVTPGIRMSDTPVRLSPLTTIDCIAVFGSLLRPPDRAMATYRPGGTLEMEKVPSACDRPVSICPPNSPLPPASCGISITAPTSSAPVTIPVMVAKGTS